MALNNKTYDTLKWIAQYLLPAAATLVLAIGGIWGLPYVEGIAATIAAVDTFLGALLGISSSNYTPAADGVLHVDHENKEAYAAVESAVSELKDGDVARFVVSETTPKS